MMKAWTIIWIIAFLVCSAVFVNTLKADGEHEPWMITMTTGYNGFFTLTVRHEGVCRSLKNFVEFNRLADSAYCGKANIKGRVKGEHLNLLIMRKGETIVVRYLPRGAVTQCRAYAQGIRDSGIADAVNCYHDRLRPRRG